MSIPTCRETKRLTNATIPNSITSMGCGGAGLIYAGCAFISLFFASKSVHGIKGIEFEDMKG